MALGPPAGALPPASQAQHLPAGPAAGARPLAAIRS
eukprot:CAMPEP_0204545100 /NCGR_PEP_ID=MMETSP0661-20131031/21014_1 /ASSEMBLY_ACC=CAM_ASM_000606 /TAXON_ID=109239 /ORGANISM="Alexandrium margalefi, Strain AMGDE01CS-322" /LENGTH=35 /DNA_ID= /DNA_START= /DNA_END= /DNA_ORIENTATION=